MLIVSSDNHLAHHSLELDATELIPSWESPQRASIVHDALASGGHEFIAPDPLDRALVARLHDSDYVAFLETAWSRWVDEGNVAPAAMGFCWPARRSSGGRPDDLVGQLGHYSFAADCSIVAGTWDAVASSAAIAQTAASKVAEMAGRQPVTFALCRPPGHHASIDQFGGYCYLNNAAIAAQVLRDAGHERVAVLDVDYHHGNGTQDIFYRRADVMFASIHADPKQEFPFFMGHASETGEADGRGANLNLPLPHGTVFAEWTVALDHALRWIVEGGCSALVVSVGVDTYVDDPISQFRLATTDFPTIGAAIADVGLPTVLVMEGGYATDALGYNVRGVIDGFEQHSSGARS